MPDRFRPKEVLVLQFEGEGHMKWNSGGGLELDYMYMYMYTSFRFTAVADPGGILEAWPETHPFPKCSSQLGYFNKIWSGDRPFS